MTIRKSGAHRALAVWVVFTLALAMALLLLGGCAVSHGVHGDSQIEATYSGWDLEADLPWQVSSATAAAAAEAGLRSLGYVIREADRTETTAKVVASTAGDEWLERTLVRARTDAGGTRVLVRVEPWGDEPRSRAIFDAIVRQLGM